MSEPFGRRLEPLIHGETLASLHARLVCMSSLDALFALDPAWTTEHLLPRLAWTGSFADQAAWHWQAHLCYWRTSLDLANAYRAEFLQALAGFEDGDSSAFRAACGNFAALGAVYGLFTHDETRQGLGAMGPSGAAIVLDTLRRRLVQSETPGTMWQELIGPWFERWPPDRRFNTEPVVEAVAELIIETDDAFGEALGWAEGRALVRPLTDRYSVLWRLTDEDPTAERRRTLAARFPAELCRFLSQIIGEQPLQPHVRECLTRILDVIEQSPRYDRAKAGELLARLQQR